MCPVCGGELVALGRLGCLQWSRCIACGMACNHELETDAYGDVVTEDDEDNDDECDDDTTVVD